MNVRENLELMRELVDRAAQGRACGNLGNTHYLLGNFTQAIRFHQERLNIAREFGDKAAERRAHSNLGNAHIFLGEFETAAEHYKLVFIASFRTWPGITVYCSCISGKLSSWHRILETGLWRLKPATVLEILTRCSVTTQPLLTIICDISVSQRN